MTFGMRFASRGQKAGQLGRCVEAKQTHGGDPKSIFGPTLTTGCFTGPFEAVCPLPFDWMRDRRLPASRKVSVLRSLLHRSHTGSRLELFP